MQGRIERPAAVELPKWRQRLVPLLGAVLLLEGCLYAGMGAASWLAPQIAHSTYRGDRTEARTIQWRHSLYDPNRDPEPGTGPPRVRLRTAQGKSVDLFRPHSKTAVVFVSDAET